MLLWVRIDIPVTLKAAVMYACPHTVCLQGVPFHVPAGRNASMTLMPVVL